MSQEYPPWFSVIFSARQNLGPKGYRFNILEDRVTSTKTPPHPGKLTVGNLNITCLKRTSEPNLHEFGFQPLIFRGVNSKNLRGISSDNSKDWPRPTLMLLDR